MHGYVSSDALGYQGIRDSFWLTAYVCMGQSQFSKGFGEVRGCTFFF